MITLIALQRMPEFAPVRKELREALVKHGAAAARQALSLRRWDADGKHILNWLLGAHNDEAFGYRIIALQLVIDEWESES